MKIYGFYKGMTFPFLTAGAMNSLFFGVYGMCLRSLEKNNRQESSEKTKYKEKESNIFIAGTIGGLAIISLGCPVDLIKIKLQSQTGTHGNSHRKHASAFTTFRHIVKKHGLRGLYFGGRTMIFRDSFSSGIYVWFYADMLSRLSRSEDEKQDIFAVLIAGGLAGVLSWASIMPLDVIKSRIQADDMSNPKYKGIFDCAIKSYKKDGLSVFGRGFIMCSVRSFPVNAATFLGYELCMKYCHFISETYFQHS
ncbi:Solute carrier family 25 member 45 [Blattella germanica]|nr:Solute carrier family 25 member 45 [Blattella germanica]